MSIVRLTDGRMYEARETAFELFTLLADGNSDPDQFLYLVVRQPGRSHARYRGLTLPQGRIATIEDSGLGFAREVSSE